MVAVRQLRIPQLFCSFLLLLLAVLFEQPLFLLPLGLQQVADVIVSRPLAIGAFKVQFGVVRINPPEPFQRGCRHSREAFVFLALQ